jgi:hypothetical protein
VLFAGRKPKDVSHAAPLHPPAPPPNAESRAASFDWTPEEDSLLLQFAKQYSFNWHLIAEMFNSSTHRVPTDRRIPWDVYDRWDKKFGPGSQQAAAAAAAAAEGPRRGADRAPKKSNKYDGPKKRLRHLSLYDALRKTQKKRETTAPRSRRFLFFSVCISFVPNFNVFVCWGTTVTAARRVNLTAHETHNQPVRQAYSPLEMSRFKGEHDRAAEARRRQHAEMQLRLQQQQALAAAQAAAGQGQPAPPVQGQPLPVRHRVVPGPRLPH